MKDTLTVLAALLASSLAFAADRKANDTKQSDLDTVNAEHATIRAESYEEALAQAKSTGSDIVVFQRGSDWNRLGEMLYNDVWMKDMFVRALGGGFILLAVDYPEMEGSTALRGPFTPEDGVQLPDTESPAPVLSAARRIARLVDDEAPMPSNEVSMVESPGGTVFRQRLDSAWLAEGKNPPQEILTLKLRATRGGDVLRFDFPTDPSLPGRGPGRAGNGNFVLTEVEVSRDGKPVKIASAWSSTGGSDAEFVFDGISDKKDKHWSGDGHHHVRRTLLLGLPEAVESGAELTVRLFCRSPWGWHMPGCLRAAVVGDLQMKADLAGAVEELKRQAKNRNFSWWDRTHCPRIALMDSEGRAVACENNPRLGLTPATLAALVRKLRDKRVQRDALWARADAATGPARAELLRQSLDVLGFANWMGNDDCYKFIHERIRAADPQDESGAVRWLMFGGDPRDGLQWAEPSWSKALEKPNPTDEDFREALARVDKELNDPRNRVLDHERVQRIMVGKYLVYSRWPKHEEERFEVQREIAAFDRDTFWGIGARGELGLHYRTPVPMLMYGWAAHQVRPGLNAWDMGDTAYFFDHSGPYKVRLNHSGGKDGLKIRRVALLDGPAVLAEARPERTLCSSNRTVEADLALRKWRADRRLVLRVEAETAGNLTDVDGSFDVEPQLLPAPSPSRLAGADRKLDAAQIKGMQSKLGEEILARAAQGAEGVHAVVTTPELQRNLTRCTLLRLCGQERVERILGEKGGLHFLQAFLADVKWMESFLASDAADWPQALENLFLLSRYGGDLDKPLNQRMATALALQWGKESRYRLVDRFRQMQQALADGLLHVSFERLDVRALRWAIPNYGTAADFKFLLDDRQTPLRDYLGAHGGVRYVSFNVYGVSVQDGWNYIGPWAHVYGNGMGNRPFPAHKRVGGVCGTVSTYGSAAAQVHGIPSGAIGQPGHCAYVVRVGREWPVGNSVTWPSDAHSPGWDGTGYPTLHRLYEPVSQDRERYMAAIRLGWLAQLQADRVKGRVRLVPGLQYQIYRKKAGGAFPDFARLTPIQTGTCATIDLSAIKPVPPSDFAVAWEGQIDVDREGPVLFGLHSDEGSQVLVDGQVVVSANSDRKEKAIVLTAGPHVLRVEYYQAGGALNLNVSLDGMLPAAATDWRETYDHAVAAQPSNYGIWLDYVKRLETVDGLPATTWSELGLRAARSLAVCNEAGWAMTRRCLEKAMPRLNTDERVRLLLACNRALTQERSIKMEGFPYDGLLNWQADAIGEPARAIQFYGELLAIHHSAKPDCNWVFGNVLNWGVNRFASNTNTSPDYAKAMASFFNSGNGAVERNQLLATLVTGIRKSSEIGNLVSFRLWTGMATQMLPALVPSDVHLKPEQAAAFPTFAPFPGDLLSKDGMLQTSSANPDDKPLSYRQLLTGGFGGWFETDKDDQPYAQVRLAGEAALTGIVLVNRYEYPPTHEASQRTVPLKVSVSMDGTTWTEVASFDKPEAVFRVDLRGRELHARYIQAERLPKPGETRPIERFHLRGFLVYGVKLY